MGGRFPRTGHMSKTGIDHRMKFGSFELDLELGELTRAGRPVPLRPLAMQALKLLVERQGRLTTREQLRDHLWQGAVLEWDQSLNQCICQVRRALGDGGRQPRYVETVPRRGYRFVAEIRQLAADPPAAGPERALDRVRFGSFLAGVGAALSGLLLLIVGLCVLLAAP